MTSPTLADDEAALANYAAALARAIDDVLPAWFDSCIGRHLPFDDWLQTPPASSYREDAAQAVAATSAAVHELLGRDIAEQTVGPLEVLRHAVSFPTAILLHAGVRPPERDDFANRNFPDDTFDLSPANFADVHPTLHEPGLMWGAAKAHVHLRRRRELAATAHTVVFCIDLMDRSKISAAYPDATFVKSLDVLKAQVNDNTLALIDLKRITDPAALADVAGRVVVFGSHVDEAVLAAATAAGAEALPRSVFFKRLGTGQL